MTVNENLYDFGANFLLIGNIFEFNLGENMIQTKIKMLKWLLRNLKPLAISLQEAVEQTLSKHGQDFCMTGFVVLKHRCEWLLGR